MIARKKYYTLINGITLYRLVAAPFLLYLVFYGYEALFKWLLALSFLTDAVDGYLARKYKVVSILGAKLDSIGDDLTVLAGITGLIVLKTEFIKTNYIALVIIFLLFLVQVIAAIRRYQKLTSYHTYLAKLAAVAQGIFLILAFFLPEPDRFLFYIAIVITGLDLLEEIIITFLLPVWKANVKGLYWILKDNNNRNK